MLRHSRVKKLLSVFLVITLFCSVMPSISLADQQQDGGGFATASMYDPSAFFSNYSSATTYKQKIEASQLPESSLASVSTENLVKAVLSTPTIYGIFSDNDRDFGGALDELISQYNTLEALNNRSDSGPVLLNEYINLDFEAIAADDGEYSFLSYFRVILLEVMLGRDIHFNRLTAEQRQELFAAVGRTVQKKIAYDVCGSGYRNVFYENMGNSASAYYNGEERLNVTRSGSDTITVYTYGGSDIGALKWNSLSDYDLTDSERVNSINRIKVAHNGLSPIAQPTKKYNCHSYAWYLPSSANDIWIPNFSASGYINCSSSTEVSSPNSGNIIVYFSSSGSILHSGVISGYSNGVLMVTSKWGEDGLYTHAYDNIDSIYFPTGGYVKYYSYSVHKQGWTYQNETTHRAICTLCGISMSGTGQHDWRIEDASSAIHRKTCRGCGYIATEQHFFVYECTSSYHWQECGMCGREKQAEPHVINEAGTLCTVCQYTGPFVIIRGNIALKP